MEINRGGVIDQTVIEARLAEEMKAYQQKLKAMADETKAAKEMGKISEVSLLKIKRIYHRLAKQLHPDINPKTSEVPELLELWNAVVSAYNRNSLEDMEEAELLVSQALERLGMGCTEIEIPDLPKKIEAVEAEIRRIKDTDPYQYKFLLEDPEAVKAKRRDLEDEIRSYADYEKELDAAIEDIMKSGVKIIWKMN